MKTFALAGNPNSGKTTLFNSLTGSTAHVGNWPGVTVDKREGLYKKLDENVSLIDLPGIYSLSPYTSEEVITRNFILQEKPDCIINIVDATNLERNLYLTTQLLEIDVPVVVALNMMDIAKRDGFQINVLELEKKLGVPVVEISALKSIGIHELMKVSFKASALKREATTVLNCCALGSLIENVSIALEGKGIENPLYHAIKLVELDHLEVTAHLEELKMVEKFKNTFNDDVFGNDFEGIIADGRYKYITQEISNLVKKKESKEGQVKFTSSDKADKILTHKYLGLPIFALILFTIFHLTFSENFLYLGGLEFFNGWISLENSAFAGVFGENGINSPGVILFKLVELLTETINVGVVGFLESINSPEWVLGFIGDGVLGGLFAILSFVPQILFLFLLFSIMEDSGYMARAAFILDRIFRRFGLSGRAVMPMIMGFGCSVPAIINTRTLADKNEKIATIRVIPFFSCGAKIPILAAISGAIVMQFGIGNADLITTGMYILGVTVAMVSVLFMKATTLKGEAPPFIMEIPPYRWPQFKSLMLHLWDKAKHFIQKAFTIILFSTIVIWFMTHFSFDWKFLPNERMNESILAGMAMLFQPIFTPLGFGSQLQNYGWVFVVAAAAGLIAKENVIATMGVMATAITAGLFMPETALEGVDSVVQMINATGITVPALISFIAFNLLTIPCFAAVAAARGELTSKKDFYTTLIFWFGTSYLVSMIIYLIGSWWWTVLIIIPLILLVIYIIKIKNKNDEYKVKGSDKCNQ